MPKELLFSEPIVGIDTGPQGDLTVETLAGDGSRPKSVVPYDKVSPEVLDKPEAFGLETYHDNDGLRFEVVTYP